MPHPEPGSADARTSVSWELKPDQPCCGAEGQPGQRFIGWVLVQVFEATEQIDGIIAHWSGPTETLLPRAVEGLVKVRQDLEGAGLLG